MIPSTSSSASSNTAIRGLTCPAREIKPITTDQLRMRTYRDPLGSGLAVRAMGLRNWIEDESHASLGRRCEFINHVVQNIIEMNLPPNREIVLVSHNAGMLLAESLITEQLQSAGFIVNWRIIDPEYKDPVTARTIQEFRETMNVDVRAFDTEQAYLNTNVGQRSLATDDRSSNAVVVLTLMPPAYEQPSHENQQSGALKLRGTQIDNISKANAIYFYLGPTTDQAGREQLRTTFSEPHFLNTSSGLWRVSCDLDGHVQTHHGSSPSSIAIHNEMTEYLDQINALACEHQQPVKLEDVDKACEHFLAAQDNNRATILKFVVSDDEVSVGNLHNFFSNSRQPTLFAALRSDGMFFL